MTLCLNSRDIAHAGNNLICRYEGDFNPHPNSAIFDRRSPNPLRTYT